MRPLVPLSAVDSGAVATAVLFYALAGVIIASALGVAFARDIVRTAVCLLFALVAVAGLYFLLSAEFLAAVQLVIYAGGTLILIIFGVMLTTKGPLSHFELNRGEVAVAAAVAAVLLATLVLAIARTTFRADAIPAEPYPLARLGQSLLGDYLVPFEVVSVLLLIVMIGAAYLAKGRPREGNGDGDTGGNDAGGGGA